jgi:hypothetical protein
MEWDKEEKLPDSVFKKFAENNMLLPALPAPLSVQWLKRLGIHDILGVVKVEEWDYMDRLLHNGCEDGWSRRGWPIINGGSVEKLPRRDDA